MAKCCLNSKNYQTLKKMFEEKPNSLFWSDEIRPLLKELERQLDGSRITESRRKGESIIIKLDHKSPKDIDLCFDGTIQCTLVETVLIEAGVEPKTSQTWRRKGFLFLKKDCPSQDTN